MSDNGEESEATKALRERRDALNAELLQLEQRKQEAIQAIGSELVLRRYPKDPNETSETVKKMFKQTNFNGVVPMPLAHRPCDRCVRALGQYPRTVCKPGAASCRRCSAMKKSCTFTVSFR